MTPFQISCAVIFVISLISGSIVLLRNYKARLNQLWFLSSLSIGIWSLGFFGVVSSNNYSQAWLWQYVLDIGGISIPIFYFTFIVYLLGLEKEYKKLKTSSWIIGIIILILSFTSLFKKGMVPIAGFNYWIDPGFLYLLFPLYFLFYVAYSFILLNKVFKRTDNIVLKKQIRYITFAQIVGFGGGITNFFPQLFHIYPVGNYLVAFYIFFISYAILKHRLFNIRVITTELLIFALWVIFLIRFLMADNMQQRFVEGGFLVAITIFGFWIIKSVLDEVKRREEIEKISKDLENANQRLQELDRTKTEFLSFATHQIKTPLTAIKGFASLIGDNSYGAVPEKVKEVSQRIIKAVNRLVDLVNNILNLGRIESGKMEYNFEEIDFVKLVSEVVEDFKQVAAEKKLELLFELEGIKQGESFKIKADAQKLRQVVQNLIDNAIKYTPEGFVKITLKNEGPSILLSVLDTGVGILPELAPHLFQKFVRETGPGQTTQGTGLGLYIAKEIIKKAHNGEIWAESEGRGFGSQFYVRVSKII